MRGSPWLLSWLLAGPCLSVPGVPIYCRRFKGDCRRSQSTCCLFLDKTTPAPTTTTSTTVDNLEEYVDELEFSDGGDPLDAQPSYVEEVFVKPSLEELKLVTDLEDPPTLAQDRSSQSSPGFCSIFKIRCSTRPSHQCCRNKAEDQLEVSSSRNNRLLGPEDRQTTKEVYDVENIEETNLTKQDEDLTNEKQKPTFSKPSKSKYTGRLQSRNFFNRKQKPTKKPKHTSSTTVSTTIGPPEKKKPTNSFKNKLKSSLFGRRPRTFDPRKSALCRIVNCGRSPHHKCCSQEKEEQSQVVTTTEAAVSETTQELSTLEITTHTDKDKNNDITVTEVAVAEDSSEAFPTTINSIIKEDDIILTTVHPSIVISSKVEAEEEGSVGVAEEDSSVGEKDKEGSVDEEVREGSVVTTVREGSGSEAGEEDYDSKEAIQGSVSEAVIDDSVDGTVNDRSVNETEKEASGGETEQEGSAEEALEEASVLEEDEGESVGKERKDSVVSEVSEKEGSSEVEASSKSLDGSRENETTEVSGEIQAEEEVHAAKEISARDEIYEDERTITTTAETLESFLTTYSTSPEPEVTQRVIAPVYVPAWRQRQEEKEEEEIKRREEEKRTRQEAAIKSQRDIIQLSNAPSMMYQEVGNSLDPSGLGDSDTVEEDQETSVDGEEDWSSDWTDCREFDCLAHPSHLCCSPHSTEKRQTVEGWQGGGPGVTVLSLPGFNSLVAPLVLEYPGRVTATVTRVEKSYSWSPWKKMDIIDNFL